MKIAIQHDETGSRFDLFADGKAGGYLTYEISGGSLDIQHTVVNADLRGNGLGEVLLDAAVVYANKNGLKIIPTCSFAKKKLSS